MLMRTCHWCKNQYDAHKYSSVYCEENPNRGRGANRLTRNKPQVYVLTMIPADASVEDVRRIMKAA